MKNLIAALALGLLPVAWADLPKIACPEISEGEMSTDCPWAGAARALIAQSRLPGGEKQVQPLFQKLLPDLDRALSIDSHRAAWKSLWGHSINFDELAGGTIVDPSIIAVLGDKFGIRAPMILTHIKADKLPDSPASALLGKPVTTDSQGHPLVHAGLEHTYGYLFSLLKTPYGYKRARWVQGEIEQGFGWKPGLLSPRPESGTLFGNVTFVAGSIAFRGNEPRLNVLKKNLEGVPAELRAFDFSKLARIRVEETVQAKDAAGEARKVVLRTDLVPFPHPQKDTHLLIYSVADASALGDVLITVFPVTQSFVDLVTRADNLGDGKPVQTRYNGFVEGVTGAKLTGSRKVLK